MRIASKLAVSIVLAAAPVVGVAETHDSLSLLQSAMAYEGEPLANAEGMRFQTLEENADCLLRVTVEFEHGQPGAEHILAAYGSSSLTIPLDRIDPQSVAVRILRGIGRIDLATKSGSPALVMNAEVGGDDMLMQQMRSAVEGGEFDGSCGAELCRITQERDTAVLYLPGATTEPLAQNALNALTDFITLCQTTDMGN